MMEGKGRGIWLQLTIYITTVSWLQWTIKQTTISARNVEQVPAGRYKQLLIFARAQIRGGSGVSHCCMFDMAR